MFKHWMGCAPANFLAGRAGFHPEAIVLHCSPGPAALTAQRCSTAGTYNSPHYSVAPSGEIQQYVEEKDTAFHAGVVVNPSWTLIKPGSNPNFYTIGIECQWSAGGEIAGAQYQSLAALILEIVARCHFPPDTGHIVLHDEIRAGVACPGNGFDRAKLLGIIAGQKQAASPASHLPDDVTVLQNANIREHPSTSARIVRLARAHSLETVLGFADSCERIRGNATWYRTGDGNFLWAGLTDKPNPAPPAIAPASLTAHPPAPASPGASGISSLDNLFTESAAPPIGDAGDAAAIAAIQDLLTGHGSLGLPCILSSSYGAWSAKTASAIQAFQNQCGLPVTGTVDKSVLQKMIEKPAVDARATRAYLTLVLQYGFSGLHKILSLVAQMEGAGKFGAFNRNTDRAGASFGLIQWAQKPGRLAEILAALSNAGRDRFVAIFGLGDPSVADGLLAYCRKPSGGVDPKTGNALSATYNLIGDPWIGRFQQAAACVPFQKVQVECAIEAFSKSCACIRSYAPDLTSERAMGFMLDVANQFGDSGAKSLYTRVHKDGMRELDVLEAVADASVAAMDDSLKTGVRTRRERFLETPFLSENVAFRL